MKFVFNASIDATYIGSFQKLRVYREGKHVMIDVIRPSEDGFEEVLTTLKGHKGRFSFNMDILGWSETGQHLNAGSEDLKFRTPYGFVGSSMEFELVINDSKIAIVDRNTDQAAFTVLPRETEWIDVC